MLVSEALAGAAVRLRSAQVQSPEVDAELIGCHILGIERAELTQQILLEATFPESKLPDFLEAVSRREKREPLQHITGLAAFRYLELEVGPGVFIPRPETEQVVSIALEKLERLGNPVVVDLCSGSGAIAIAIATELAGSKVYGVELSETAFGYLKRNFERYGLDTNQLENQDLNSAFGDLAGVVDFVISNPPYIPEAAVPIDLEVQLHDPELALYGGPDGLDVIREISDRAQMLLRSGGQLLLEHADTQASAVGELLLAKGWQEVDSFQDLTGKDRMTYAVKP